MAQTPIIMVKIKDTTDQIAGLLRDFAKAKNFGAVEIRAVRSRIRALILAAVVSPETATVRYKQVCLDFMERVIRVRGVARPSGIPFK
jgi:hypothetical protein